MRAYELQARPLSSSAPLLLPLILGTSAIAGEYFQGGVTLATGIFGSLMIALGLPVLAFLLTPVRLRADDSGITWSQFGYHRVWAWSEIAEIGVARNRNFDGYEKSLITRSASRQMPIQMLRRPSVGINLETGSRNPATLSYRRGATGFEINLRNHFGVGVDGIVAELQTRLHLATDGPPEPAL